MENNKGNGHKENCSCVFCKSNKRKTDFRIVITAIICLSILECWALANGINGTIFSAVIAIIAGLAGWTMPQLKFK